MALWATTKNAAETARELGLPESTIKTIVKRYKDDDEFVELQREKKKEFSEQADEVIELAFERLRELLGGKTPIPANQLAIIIGTLTDKKLLLDGKATGNVTVSIKLPEGIDDYAG